MANALTNAFKNKELRKKLAFTVIILIVVRFGSQLPIPGIDTAQVTAYLKEYIGRFIQSPELFYRRVLFADVCICTECYAIYYIFHHLCS